MIELDEIQKLYNECKIKNFDSKIGLEGLQKANVVTRVNKRLLTAIEQGKVKTEEEAISFIDKQIAKLDRLPKKKKEKGNSGFKYGWGEDIYKKYAFLGAELNNMREHSSFNKKLIEKIKFFEKTGVKPHEKEVEKFVQSIMSQMDKENLNESELLRRKSIENVLQAVMESETETLEFSEKNEETGEDEVRTLIFLKLEAQTLSFSEVRALKELFEFEEDPSSNIVLIEAGVVATTENDPGMPYLEDIARSNVISLLVDNLVNHGFIYQKKDAETFVEKAKNNAEETKRELKREFNKEKNKAVEHSFYQKPWFYNVMIGTIAILIVGILSYRIYDYFIR